MSGSGDDQQLEGVTTATNTPLLGTSFRAARERPFLPAYETTYGVDQFEGAMGDSTFGNGNGIANLAYPAYYLQRRLKT